MSEGVLITDALDKILETSWAILVAVLPLRAVLDKEREDVMAF